MKLFFSAIIMAICASWALAFVPAVYAQAAPPAAEPTSGSAMDRLRQVGEAADLVAPQQERQLATIIGRIITAASSLLGVIFVAQMVYAGWLWMTARDEAEQLEKAKHIIRRSIVGLAIVLGAWAITSFVVTKIGGTVA